jgi:hypothetical protein
MKWKELRAAINARVMDDEEIGTMDLDYRPSVLDGVGRANVVHIGRVLMDWPSSQTEFVSVYNGPLSASPQESETK